MTESHPWNSVLYATWWAELVVISWSYSFNIDCHDHNIVNQYRIPIIIRLWWSQAHHHDLFHDLSPDVSSNSSTRGTTCGARGHYQSRPLVLISVFGIFVVFSFNLYVYCFVDHILVFICPLAIDRCIICLSLIQVWRFKIWFNPQFL